MFRGLVHLQIAVIGKPHLADETRLRGVDGGVLALQMLLESEMWECGKSTQYGL